jgi:hypothetical protein
MKKKLITTLTMSTLLLFGTFSTALAAPVIVGPGTNDVSPPEKQAVEKGTIPLSADVNSSYLITIPTKVDFGTLKKPLPTDPDTFESTDINMTLVDNAGFSAVNVTLGDSNTVLTRTSTTGTPGDATIPYSVEKSDGTVIADTTANIANLTPTTKTGTCTLKVDKTKITKGGHYTGNLIFTFTGVEA